MPDTTTPLAGREGSVALYSLGSPRLLADATGEIVELLDHWGLLDPDAAVLDIGCEIGRLEALSRRVASVTGIDISQATLSDLEGIADESVDLVLLIDTLPHMILSGSALAAELCAELARVLAPGGSLFLLYASYGDADADLAELTRLAEDARLEFHRADWRPLSSWDAPAFELTKARR